MSLLIIETYAKCGQKIAPENTDQELDLHNSTVIAFCKDLVKYNGTLTMEEIKYCFNTGYKRENVYGEYFGLNNRTYFQWINGYTFCEDRTKAVKAISDVVKGIENPPAPPKTEEQIAEINKKGAIYAWNEIRTGQEFLDMGNVVYNYLDGLKMIPFSGDRKKEIMEETKTELVEEKKEELNKVAISESGKPQYDKIFAKNIKSDIEALRFGEPIPYEKDNNGNPKFKVHPLVISRTKRNALRIYMQELLEIGEDFETLLENRLSEISTNKE